jgi:hypothetical protein
VSTSDADPTPEETPQPPPGETPAPEWATKLQRTLEEFPAKLRATVTDDDKQGIAQGVFDLFERGGAFSHEEASENTDKEVTTDEEEAEAPTKEKEPRKQSRWSGFAARFEGDG